MKNTTRKLIKVSWHNYESLPRYKYLIQIGYSYAELQCLFRDREEIENSFKLLGFEIEGEFKENK